MISPREWQSHEGHFRQVNDSVPRRRPVRSARSSRLRQCTRRALPAARRPRRCTRALLCTDPGHGPRSHLWEPAGSGPALTGSRSCARAYARKPAPSPAPAPQCPARPAIARTPTAGTTRERTSKIQQGGAGSSCSRRALMTGWGMDPLISCERRRPGACTEST